MTTEDVFTAANAKIKRLELEVSELKEKLARAEALKQGAEEQAACFLVRAEDERSKRLVIEQLLNAATRLIPPAHAAAKSRLW